MGMLFISYRRSETQDITARIHLRLAQHFGADSIFIDIDSIPIGYDFRQALRNAVNASNVVLVIIGTEWMRTTNDQGTRRLDDPDDFVRIEVEAALARNIPVVPVLTQGAHMPKSRDLPPSISEFAFRHGVDVRSDQHFNDDVDQLVARLIPAMTEPNKERVAPVGVSQPPVVPMATPVEYQAVPAVYQTAQPVYQAPAYPPPHVPPELAQLGFRGVNVVGTPAIEPPLCAVPGGRFLMGSDERLDENARSDEMPQHWVDVPSFHIARYPVTVAEYALAIEAGRIAEPEAIGALTWEQQLLNPANPVVCMTWSDAKKYCAWLATTTQRPWRLATEEQWEKAARWDASATTSRVYPWGNTFERPRCNTRDGGAGRMQPVGAHSPQDPATDGSSPYGAEDMAGNVWEWTSSDYKRYPQAPDDAQEEPLSDYKITRGGSWLDSRRDVRAAYRSLNRAANAGDLIGFRLVLEGR